MSLPFRDNSMQCMITSPPYFGQRVYGNNPDEIGLEPMREFLAATVMWMREVDRVLDDEAVAWIVIGETQAGSGGAGGDHKKGSYKDDLAIYRQGKPVVPLVTHRDRRETTLDDMLDDEWALVDHKLGVGQVCQIPFHVAAWLQAEGWVLRQQIIWDKGGPSRGTSLTHEKRPRTSYETILMLTRHQSKYRWFPERLTEEQAVWHVRPGKTKGKKRSDGTKYPAPYPDELVGRMLLPTTSPGDTVLDPFVGSGTTVSVAEKLGRVGVGVDLYRWD